MSRSFRSVFSPNRCLAVVLVALTLAACEAAHGPRQTEAHANLIGQVEEAEKRLIALRAVREQLRSLNAEQRSRLNDRLSTVRSAGAFCSERTREFAEPIEEVMSTLPPTQSAGSVNYQAERGARAIEAVLAFCSTNDIVLTSIDEALGGSAGTDGEQSLELSPSASERTSANALGRRLANAREQSSAALLDSARSIGYSGDPIDIESLEPSSVCEHLEVCLAYRMAQIWERRTAAGRATVVQDVIAALPDGDVQQVSRQIQASWADTQGESALEPNYARNAGIQFANENWAELLEQMRAPEMSLTEQLTCRHLNNCTDE